MPKKIELIIKLVEKLFFLWVSLKNSIQKAVRKLSGGSVVSVHCWLVGWLAVIRLFVEC